VERFNPPPPLSTPKHAPWTEAENLTAGINQLGAMLAELLLQSDDKLNRLINLIIALPGPSGDGSFLATPLISNVDDAGEATGGSNNTLTDTTKYWSTNVWGVGAIILMSIGGQFYTSLILSNNDQTITFSPLPSGVKPIAGTPYAIKSINSATSYSLVTKTVTEIIDLSSIAALATSTLAQCTAIDLLVGPSALALTVECTFNAAATLGIRVHVRTSYDGTNYDTQDFDSWVPVFTAGASIRVTKSYDVSPAYMKVLIENMDAAQTVTAVSVQSTVRG
jgi:hypothetical protein